MIARLLIVPAGDQIVLRRTDRMADVAYPHRRAIAIGDDQVVVLVGTQQLIVGVERVGLARAVERAFGQIDIGLAEHGAHVLEADAASRQSLRIELHTDRGLLLAADADETNAGDLRYLLQQDVFRIGIDGGQRQAVRTSGQAPGSAYPPG